MAIMTLSMSSSMLGCSTQITAILPDSPEGIKEDEYYSSGKKYKVLWLLHGGGGDNNSWIYESNIVRYVKERNVIVVMPSALTSDFANHPQFQGGYSFSDFFFNQLMPLIHGWLPASSNPEDNYITGMSMGGAGALLLGFMHPEKFGGIAPLACSLRDVEYLRSYHALTSAEFRALTLADPKKFPTEFGDPKFGITLKEVNMICKYPTVGDYLDSYENTWDRYIEISPKVPKMYMSCGTKDGCYPLVLKFKKLTEQLGMDNVTFSFLKDNGHTPDCWEIAIQNVLDFFEI